MLPWIIPFISSNGLFVALCLGALAVFATYDQSRVQAGRNIERVENDKANRKAASVADRVRSKSRSGSVRGIVDPNLID